MVLPPAEILLVGQRARGDVGLAVVWRWGCQAQCDGGGSGLCNGSAEIWYRQMMIGAEGQFVDKALMLYRSTYTMVTVHYSFPM